MVTTKYWRVWCTPAFLQRCKSSLDSGRTEWLDACLEQVQTDFGITLRLRAGQSFDGSHLDVVLDPASQGGAHTGTVFGSYGVSVSPDAIYNAAYGMVGFWWYLLTMHETVNVITGSIAQDWVWADGSSLWNGTSPFPNMCDAVVASECGRREIGDAQETRMAGDPGVQLFRSILRTYGDWTPYRRLFRWTVANDIKDWRVYPEPIRTAILVWFLDCASSRAPPEGETLLVQFNNVIQALSGQKITPAAYARAKALFPSPSRGEPDPTDLQGLAPRKSAVVQGGRFAAIRAGAGSLEALVAALKKALRF